MNTRREFLKSIFQTAVLTTALVYCPRTLVDLPKLAPKLAQQALGSFEKFTFPIIRSVYPNLIASKICNVQPMSGPTSQIFYLDYLYKKPWWKRVFKRSEKRNERDWKRHQDAVLVAASRRGPL